MNANTIKGALVEKSSGADGAFDASICLTMSCAGSRKSGSSSVSGLRQKGGSLKQVCSKTQIFAELIYSFLVFRVPNDPVIITKDFRGELVTQNPDDAPASVLLERIQGE